MQRPVAPKREAKMAEKLTNFFTSVENNRLSRMKEAVLFAVLFFLATFAFYTMAFASNDELRFLGAYNLDKIAHFLGGVFIAGSYEWLTSRRRLITLAVIFFALTVGWEVFEFLFIGDVIRFYHLSPNLWRLDAIGDITVAALGCYGYWVFSMNRETRPETTRQ